MGLIMWKGKATSIVGMNFKHLKVVFPSYNEGKESAIWIKDCDEAKCEGAPVCDEYDEYEGTPRIDDIQSNEWQPAIIVGKMRNYKKSDYDGPPFEEHFFCRGNLFSTRKLR